MKQIFGHSKSLWFAILLIAAVIRLPFIDKFPPIGPGLFWLRTLTSVTSLFTIWSTMYLVKQKSSLFLALTVGITMAVTPWHIENSRIYSPAMLGLALVLIICLVMCSALNRTQKTITALFITLLIPLVYKDLWFLSYPLNNVSLFNRLPEKAFHLMSGEWLFFKNETFWGGGLRTSGVFLPSFIPLYYLGLLMLIRRINKKHILLLITIVVWWIISAINPRYPEGREFFFILPLLCLAVAQGLVYVLSKTKRQHYFIKALILTYFLFMAYEYTVYAHDYINHYSQRVKNEIPYEQRTF